MESSVESWKGQERIDWNKTKQCERMSAPWSVRAGGSLRDYIILFLFHMGKLESHKVCSDNGTGTPKLKIQSCWGETMPPRILQCHSSWHRASSDGVISWFTRALSTPTGRELRNALLWNMGSLVQCWQNDINTPTENLHIILSFLKFFLHMFSLTFNSLYMQSFCLSLFQSSFG